MLSRQTTDSVSWSDGLPSVRLASPVNVALHCTNSLPFASPVNVALPIVNHCTAPTIFPLASPMNVTLPKVFHFTTTVGKSDFAAGHRFFGEYFFRVVLSIFLGFFLSNVSEFLQPK